MSLLLNYQDLVVQSDQVHQLEKDHFIHLLCVLPISHVVGNLVLSQKHFVEFFALAGTDFEGELVVIGYNALGNHFLGYQPSLWILYCQYSLDMLYSHPQ